MTAEVPGPAGSARPAVGVVSPVLNAAGRDRCRNERRHRILSPSAAGWAWTPARPAQPHRGAAVAGHRGLVSGLARSPGFEVELTLLGRPLGLRRRRCQCRSGKVGLAPELPLFPFVSCKERQRHEHDHRQRAPSRSPHSYTTWLATPAPAPCPTLALAVPPDAWPGREACFIDVVVWGPPAEACARYLDKGRRVAVLDRLDGRGRRTSAPLVPNLPLAPAGDLGRWRTGPVAVEDTAALLAWWTLSGPRMRRMPFDGSTRAGSMLIEPQDGAGSRLAGRRHHPAHQRGPSLTAADVIDVLGTEVVAAIPVDAAVVRSIDAGLLQAHLHRRSVFRRLARSSSPAPSPSPTTTHPTRPTSLNPIGQRPPAPRRRPPPDAFGPALQNRKLAPQTTPLPPNSRRAAVRTAPARGPPPRCWASGLVLAGGPVASRSAMADCGTCCT